MRKLAYRILMLVLVLTLFLPFLVKGSDGRPVMTMSDMMSLDPHVYKGRLIATKNRLMRMAEKFYASTTSDFDGIGGGGLTEAYRWQDENGEWHFSDRPAEGSKAEKILINPDASVTGFGQLEAKLVEMEAAEAAKAVEAAKKGGSEDKENKNYLERMTSTLDDAKNVEGLVNDRYQKQLERTGMNE